MRRFQLLSWESGCHIQSDDYDELVPWADGCSFAQGNVAIEWLRTWRKGRVDIEPSMDYVFARYTCELNYIVKWLDD